MPSRKNSGQKSGRRVRSKKGGSKGSIMTTSGSRGQSQVSANKRSHNPSFQKGTCMSALGRALNPFPSSWRTTMNSSMTGTMAIGAAATGHFNVAFNSIVLPWNTANPWPAPAGGFATATATPAGFTALLTATGPYIAYRVYGSAIRVRMTPAAAADTLAYTTNVRVGNVFPNYSSCAQSESAKSTTASTGSRTGTITAALAVIETSGDDPAAINFNSGFAAAYNALPTYYGEWETWYALDSGAVTTGLIAYEVDVVWDVVCENPQYDRATLDSIAAADERGVAKAYAYHYALKALKEEESLNEERRLQGTVLLDDNLDAKSDGGSVRASASSSSATSTMKNAAARKR